ncbi:MAG: sigma 54-interacting transcriptional regulator [Sandaracinaceae bacterium]
MAELGSGASARTWLAHDETQREDVTLKILETPELASALRREFARLRGLRHPALARVRDFGSAPQDDVRRLYYAAVHVPGVELGRWIEAAPRSEPALRGVLTDVTRALGYLASVGLRHGDVKPANVIVTPEGRGVLIDLGCAAALDAPIDTLSGTPGYWAPELERSRLVDARADLFSLGRTVLALAERSAAPIAAPLLALARQLASDRPSDRPTDAAAVLEALGADNRLLGPRSRVPARLLGRDAERSAGRALVDRLLAGEPGARALWIHGAEGLGRTRLLREITWDAQLRLDVVELDPRTHGSLRSALERLDADPSALATLARGAPALLVVDDAHLLDADDARDLDALGRSLAQRSDARIGLFATSIDPPRFLADACVLAPLSPPAIAAWCGPRVPEARHADVARLTGGYPSAIAGLLDRLDDADASLDDLMRVKDLAGPSERRLEALRALTPGPRRALVRICLEDGRSTAEGYDPADLEALATGGWIERDAHGVALGRPTDASRWLAALDPELVRDVRLALADALKTERPARAAQLLAEAGLVDRAEALLPPHGPLGGYAAAAEAVIAAGPSTQGRLLAARIIAENGRPERALKALEPTKDTSGFGELLLEGECRFRLGELEPAARILELAIERARDGTERAMALDVLSRCRARAGNHREALELAEAAFDALESHEEHPALRARLLEDRGVALSYLGDNEEAERTLESASRLAESGAPRDRVRIASYRGINAYRIGRTALAVACHREALSIAEEHGLSDHIASCALNLGSALHQTGEWGPALHGYERGLDVAAALGKASTRRTLELNLAKLCSDIGLFERAAQRAEAVESEARAEGLTFWSAAALSVLGEAWMGHGERSAAGDAFARAAALFEKEGAEREALEVGLSQIELELASGDAAAAGARLAALSPRIAELGGQDVCARLELLRAELAGQEPSALDALEKARRLAGASGQRLLQAEVERRAAWFWAGRGSLGVAARHAEAARDAWERTEGLLPESLREAFRRHPRRSLPELTARTREPAVAGPDPRVAHLLAINRKLNSSLDPARVLDATIDAAIELTGAERGFVILVDDDGSQSVAVARNLDRERVPRSHLKVSHSIAERVIESAEPVLTVDAQEDPRFRDQASVHAMKLRSVICVPIRSPDGILGALYLDNRFRAERFGRADLEVVVAFSDQAALAIRNARLVAALEVEKARAVELARGQAIQIDELEQRVRSQSEALAHRYDYSHIVAESDAMRRVFGLLDRITANHVSVLICGESGTGKELVARAIHFNGPRREGPFVTVNCGALPDTLLESELFGHVRGAFTGATEDKDGLFVSARGGTIFLDEVSEMSEAMQVKLLRVLQERTVRPLGQSKELPIDVRVLAATNRDLAEDARSGRFREDLYYRVAVVDVRLPPLRERMEDLPLLADHLLARIAEEVGGAPKNLGPGALRRLATHDWPGNVRELRNVLARAFVLADATINGEDIDTGPRPTGAGTKKDRDRDERE